MTGPEPSAIAGVVLAGGRSRRMGGRDKALLPLAGTPLVAHALSRLAPQVGAVAINANGDPEPFAGMGAPVFADAIGGYLGPLAGILSAMRWAADRGGFSHIVTVAADTPFFPPDLVADLASEAADGGTIVMARSGGNTHPVFALWPIALSGDLEQWLGAGETLSVRAWAGHHRLAIRDFPLRVDGVDPFFNINTPEDLAAAEAVLSGTNA